MSMSPLMISAILKLQFAIEEVNDNTMHFLQLKIIRKMNTLEYNKSRKPTTTDIIDNRRNIKR
jgi:hypothetical protein